jgi:uncharacterized protein YkwD
MTAPTAAVVTPSSLPPAAASSTALAAAAALAPAAAAAAAPDDVSAALVAAHNGFRATHHAPPLRWDAALAAGAQAWAEACVFQHSSPNGEYGENLYTSSATADAVSAAQAAVSSWYDEVSAYDYATAQFSSGTGHFTQVVWVTSTALGCGVTTSCGGKAGVLPTYVVCRYSPAGNMMGSFQQNVLPA